MTISAGPGKTFTLGATSVTATAAPYDVIGAEAVALDLPCSVCAIEVSNAAGAASLTDFKVELSQNPKAASPTWEAYLSSTDWASANDNMMFCTAQSPHDLAAGETAYARISIKGAMGVRFSAKVAAGTGSVTIVGRVT